MNRLANGLGLVTNLHFVSENLNLSIDITGTFLHVKAQIERTDSVWSSSLVRGTQNPKEVCVCAAAIGGKIETTSLGYFSLVALY